MTIKRSDLSTTTVRPVGITPATGLRAHARGLNEVSDLAARFATVADRVSTQLQGQLGAERGRRYGARTGPDGKPMALDEFPVDPISTYGQAFRGAAAESYVATVRNHARAQADTLAAKYKDDSVNFDQAFSLYADETLNNVDPAIAAGLQLDLASISNVRRTKIVANEVALEREIQFDGLQQDNDELESELATMIGLGQTDDPAFATKKQQFADNLAAMVRANYRSPGEAKAELNAFEFRIRKEAVLATVRTKTNLGDWTGADALVNEVLTDPAFDLDPGERRDIATTADAVVTDAFQRQERGRIRSERELNERQLGQYRNLVRRQMNGDPSLTMEEVLALEAKGAIRTEHAASLIPGMRAELIGRDNEQRARDAAQKIVDYSDGVIGFTDIVANQTLFTPTQWIQLNAVRRARADAILENGLTLDQEVAYFKIATELHRDMPVDPDKIEAYLQPFIEKRVMSGVQATNLANSYRNSFAERIGTQSVLNATNARLAAGLGFASKEQRRVWEEAYAASIDPFAEAHHGSLVSQMLAGGEIFTPVKNAFEGVGALPETQARIVLDLYEQMIDTPHHNGRGLLNSRLGAQTVGFLDTLSRMTRQSKTFREALDKTHAKFSDDKSSLGRVLGAFGDREELEAELLAEAGSVVTRMVDDNSGLVNWIKNIFVDSYDQRFRPFIEEMDMRGIDIDRVEIPGDMMSEVIDNARGLLATGQAPSPKLAVEAALVMTMREWGPEIVSREEIRETTPERIPELVAQRDNGAGLDLVRWTRHPIAQYANTSERPSYITINEQMIRDDARFKLRSIFKNPPPGYDTWDQVPVRFRVLPSTLSQPGGPSYRLEVFDRRSKLWDTIDIENPNDPGDVRQLTYNYDFRSSVQGVAYDEALREIQSSKTGRAMSDLFLIGDFLQERTVDQTLELLEARQRDRERAESWQRLLRGNFGINTELGPRESRFDVELPGAGEARIEPK